MKARGEEGFTLVELMVSTSIMVIIGGVLSAGLVVGLRSTGKTADRLTQSSDAELLASYFVPDVESTQSISVTDSSCGGGTAVARFRWVEWNDLLGNVRTSHTVSYAYVAPIAPATTGSLVRSHCTGTSMTPLDTQTLSRYLVPTTPSIACATPAACAGSPVPRTVSLTVTDRLPDGGDWAYTVSGTRRAT